MQTKLHALAERTLVAILVAAFLTPLALDVWLWLAPEFTSSFTWLSNTSLSGVQVLPEKVAPSGPNVLSGAYQSAFGKSYDTHFAGREFMIRALDELYLRAFRSAPVGLWVGPNSSLIEQDYLEEYCLFRNTRDRLLPLVNDLRRLQDFCDARGIPFALLITPSKAAIQPEDLSASWRRRFKPGPRSYDDLLPLLHEKNIRFVDGHRIAADLKTKSALPVFPPGGTHWGDPAALATANAMLETLAGAGLRVTPIHEYTTKITHDPVDQDRDLADLLNILSPPHYPVEQITIPPMASSGDRPNLVMVGGSFLWKPLAMLDASRQFSEIELYYYYTRSQNCRLDGELHTLAEPAPPLNFERQIFAADALVLECNEQTLPEPDHLVAFLHDALMVLPDPHAAKAPFQFQGWIEYQWGGSLVFNSSSGIDMAATKGFSPPTESGAYTIGSVSSIHFKTPPANADMVLEVTASAYIVGARLPRQTVRVLANGHPIAQWVWNDPASARRECAIPKEFVNTGDTRIEFRIENPKSPVDLGIGTDQRKFGIIVSRLRLRALQSLNSTFQ